MADEGFSLPDDAFVQILLLLPTSSRRWLRLVCKRWRGVIDDRTAERQVQTKILAFTSVPNVSRAHVFDEEDGRRRHVWAYRSSYTKGGVAMVCTCNGLLCLHGRVPCGDGVAATSPPSRFGYHPTTGRYKVVHVPCRRRLTSSDHTLQVFTLGDASWREVASPGGIVSVDGSTYWLTSRGDRVMSMDLADEHVASFSAPPVVRRRPDFPGNPVFHVTNVHARLGVAVGTYEAVAPTRVDVWVLEAGGRRGETPARWSRTYSVAARLDEGLWITWPYVAHGEHVQG
ncbi:hypothetical protein E2562_031641 [Oryza meyeriana var. granulata]|uniref:F-box domain-containing protein n=1 Tax=Oryza meyeriana var. granulata TaxID=110450 RepID=A0A6G1D9S1_9ORYZ|nr:hypothetical protein E2562_031641 [Oryza meyeriana var. granulata]